MSGVVWSVGVCTKVRSRRVEACKARGTMFVVCEGCKGHGTWVCRVGNQIWGLAIRVQTRMRVVPGIWVSV